MLGWRVRGPGPWRIPGDGFGPVQAAASRLGAGARRRVTLRKACCSRGAPSPPPSRRSQSGAAGAPAIWFSVEGGGSWGRQGWEEVWSDRPGSSPQTGHKVRGGEDGGAEPGTRGDTALRRAGLAGRDKGSGGIQVGRRGQCKSLAIAQGHSEPGRPGPQEEVPEDAGGGGLLGWGGLRPGHWRLPGNLSHPEGEGLLALGETG